MTHLRQTYLQDEVHDRWETVYRGDPLLDRFNDRIMDRLLKYAQPPPNALFLDAGCGAGDHSLRLARRGYRCVGVDLSERVLSRARARILQAGLNAKVVLVCQALEDLAFADGLFDAVHCRGVLMHIPAWEKALGQLIRVLKPGGKIAILELNDQSLESWMVRIARRFRASQSTMTRTAGGLEFWSQEDGHPLLARVASIKCLEKQLKQLGSEVCVRSSSEFWDINRFPAGTLRRGAIRFNVLWFALRLSSRLSSGNLVVGQKGTP